MKTWHIAALVVVGLIVAGIAYTMYEKRSVVPIRKSIGVGGEYRRKRKNMSTDTRDQDHNLSLWRGPHRKTIEREEKRAKKDDTHYYKFDDFDDLEYS